MKQNDKWDRLKQTLELNGEVGQRMMGIMRQVELEVATEEQHRKERFESYAPKRDPNEPHDAGCQITRLGARSCCTCESNRTRRQQQVVNAALAGDLEFRATLGGMESHSFDIAAGKARKTGEPMIYKAE